MDATHSSDTPSPSGRGRGPFRWLAILAVLALAAVGLSLVIGGGDGSGTDRRAATAAMDPADIAAAVGSQPEGMVRVNPPIDVEAIIRAARALPMVDVPMPDSQHVESFRSSDSGQEITQAFLWYDDDADAAKLDGLAAKYLASALGLDTAPTTIDGVTDARRWTGQGYEALSFRSDGVFVLVAATTTDDEGAAERLAAGARDKVAAVRPTLEAAATQTAAVLGATR